MITRGFGEGGALIARSFVMEVLTEAVSAAEEAAETARKVLAQGGARAKKKIEETYDEFIVRAALIAVNGEEIINPVWRTVTKAINETKEAAVKVTDFAEIKVTKPTVQIVIDKMSILKD